MHVERVEYEAEDLAGRVEAPPYLQLCLLRDVKRLLEFVLSALQLDEGLRGCLDPAALNLGKTRS